MQGKGFNGAHRPGNMAFGQRRGGFGGEGNIHLSEAQRQQMKTINDSYHKQLVALEANDKLSLGDYKTQLAALHKSHEQQIQGVYTDEQKAKMANFKKERQINMQSMAAGRMEKMKLELGLSDDQVAKLKTQHEQLSAQMKSLHENSDLLPEQKRAQMQTLMAQQKDQFKSVLTPEQTSKLDSMQKHHFQRPGGFQGGHQGWQAK
jgi:Spy/CpxP family protein refolding chaperone